MKKLFLVLLFLALVTNCFAGVEAEIVAKDLDDNGNIRVWTQYKIDGVEVESNYPKIDGKSVYCVRFNALNFMDMNATEIKDKIIGEAKSHCENLIQKTWVQKQNAEIIDKEIKGVVGSKLNITETTRVINGKDGKEYILKTDGTITISVSP